MKERDDALKRAREKKLDDIRVSKLLIIMVA